VIALEGRKGNEDTFEEVEEFEEFEEADDEFTEVGDDVPVDEGSPVEAAPRPRPGPPDDKGSGDFQIVMGTGDMSSQAPMERLDSVERALDEAIRRMDMTERGSEAVTHDINTVKESISRMEANMRELTSLYDLISGQLNPFIDVDLGNLGEGATEPAETPSFDALFEPTPEITSEGGAVEPGKPTEYGGPPAGIFAPSEGAPVEGVMPQYTATHPPTERPLKVARLTQIGSDSTCLMALVRWIEFMLSRVRRDQVSSLLSFYVKIGWISDGVRNHVLDVIRGIRPGLTSSPAAPTTESATKDKEGDVVMAYGKERTHDLKTTEPRRPLQEDWKLTVEDHLKSLIFIEKIRGSEINRDRLEELERDVKNLGKGLEGFFGL
jgi:flagellar protein FlaD